MSHDIHVQAYRDLHVLETSAHEMQGSIEEAAWKMCHCSCKQTSVHPSHAAMQEQRERQRCSPEMIQDGPGHDML